MSLSEGEPSIVYEDASFVAVRKPPRMHSAPGLGAGDLCAWVFERFSDAALLHRLDFETSGIVLFARSPEAFAALKRQQKEGAFYKEYLALSTVSNADMPEGSAPRSAVPSGIDEVAWSDARDRLDGLALAACMDRASGEAVPRIASAFRSFGPRGSRVACLGSGGGRGGSRVARAGSTYSSDMLACSAGLKRSDILEIRVGLFRGFRHQVRAHLAWVGLPISGDPLYGGAADDRLGLYAVGLSFDHPLTGERMRLAAEPA